MLVWVKVMADTTLSRSTFVLLPVLPLLPVVPVIPVLPLLLWNLNKFYFCFLVYKMSITNLLNGSGLLFTLTLISPTPTSSVSTTCMLPCSPFTLSIEPGPLLPICSLTGAAHMKVKQHTWVSVKGNTRDRPTRVTSLIIDIKQGCFSRRCREISSFHLLRGALN